MFGPSVASVVKFSIDFPPTRCATGRSHRMWDSWGRWHPSVASWYSRTSQPRC